MADKPATLSANLVGLVLGIGNSIFTAHVFTYWWLWFVTPFGLPAIGTAHAWALVAVAGFFLRGVYVALAERTETLPDWKQSSHVIAKPLVLAALTAVMWLIFYGVHRLM